MIRDLLLQRGVILVEQWDRAWRVVFVGPRLTHIKSFVH